MEDLRNILDGCIRNSHREQKKLYEHYYGYCLKVVFRYIYRYEKAVDVVNDGYIKIFRNFNKFQIAQPENTEMILMGWMRTIMINTAIDCLRKNDFMPEIGAIPEHIWEQEDKSTKSDQQVLYKELICEIRKLPPAYRLVFNMYVIDGFTHQEIADKLGIAVGTSKSNLSKARGLLQKTVLKSNDEAEICMS